MELKFLLLVIVVCGICFGGVIAAANVKDDIHIEGIAQDETHECKGRTVHISGSKNKVSLNGVCPKVHISGSNNEVLIDTAGSIIVSGFSNKVYWQKALKGNRPSVSKSGFGNTISKAK